MKSTKKRLVERTTTSDKQVCVTGIGWQMTKQQMDALTRRSVLEYVRAIVAAYGFTWDEIKNDRRG
jgi:hypothetical protein